MLHLLAFTTKTNKSKKKNKGRKKKRNKNKEIWIGKSNYLNIRLNVK